MNNIAPEGKGERLKKYKRRITFNFYFKLIYATVEIV